MNEIIPINKIAQQPYSWLNCIALIQAMEENHFSSPEFLTFLQARELSLKIKKWSRGFWIIKYWENEEEWEKYIKKYYVFNIEQCETLQSNQ